MKREDKTALNTMSAESASLPEIYDELLTQYVDLLRRYQFNSYQSYIKLFVKSFNPLFQLRFWRSPFIRDFLRVPNTLKQDLFGASDVLTKLQTFNAETLESVIAMNGINFRRLQKRSALNWLNKLAIGTGGILGLLSALDKVTSIDIVEAIPPFAIDALVYSLFCMVVGGAINIIISMPKIGLVRAFGDILQIARAYQHGKNVVNDDRPSKTLQPTQKPRG